MFVLTSLHPLGFVRECVRQVLLRVAIHERAGQFPAAVHVYDCGRALSQADRGMPSCSLLLLIVRRLRSAPHTHVSAWHCAPVCSLGILERPAEQFVLTVGVDTGVR